MKKFFNIGMLLMLIVVVISSCKKEDYLDTGIHDAKFKGTVWQYLESRPDMFDTLMVILKEANLDNVIKNEEVTFFAPPDQSILKSIWKLNKMLYSLGQDTITDVRQVKPEIWRFYLSKYIFKGKFLSKDFRQIDTLNLAAFQGGVYKNYLNTEMNVGVLYNDIVTESNTGSQVIKYAGYRQLYLNYPHSVAVPDDMKDYILPFVTAPVATSDIQPTNGVLHVIQFSKHAFGFLTNTFVNDAYNVGILPKK